MRLGIINNQVSDYLKLFKEIESKGHTVYYFKFIDTKQFQILNNEIIIPKKETINILTSINTFKLDDDILSTLKQLELDIFFIDSSNSYFNFVNNLASLLTIPLIMSYELDNELEENDLLIKYVNDYKNFYGPTLCQIIIHNEVIDSLSDYGLTFFQCINADILLKEFNKTIDEYKDNYLIEKTIFKNNYVILDLNIGNDNCKLNLLLDDYYELKINKTNSLNNLSYCYLKNKEKENLGYLSCLKRLSNKDYATKEIINYLKEHYELKEYQVTNIIHKLKDLKLLDDKQYTLNKIATYNELALSRKAIKDKLRKVGISVNLIENSLNEGNSDERQKATIKANKYLRNLNNKSLKMAKSVLYAKLQNDGFTSTIINEVINESDFKEINDNENETLKKETHKLLIKYQRKYSGNDLYQKLTLALVQKGFSYDNIKAIIKEMELENGQ